MKISIPRISFGTTDAGSVPVPETARGIIHTARGDQKIRRTTTAVVLGIAGFAGYISYRHAYELASNNGEDQWSAWALPLTIDGLIFSASMVILRANRHHVKVPKMAWFAMALGILATLGANVAHGIPYGPVGMATSAWPAIALVVSFEMLMRLFKPVQEDASVPETAVEPVVVQETPGAASVPETSSEPVADTTPVHVPAPRPVRAPKAAKAELPRDERYAKGLHAYHVSKQGPGRPLSQRDLAAVMGLRNRELAIQIMKDYMEAEAAGNLAALLFTNVPKPEDAPVRPDTIVIETDHERGEKGEINNAVLAEA